MYFRSESDMWLIRCRYFNPRWRFSLACLHFLHLIVHHHPLATPCTLVERLPLRLTLLLNSLSFLHMGEPVSKLLEWGGPPEDQAVSGSVVEFAFGLEENSYLATSYPHRPHLADKHDVRTINVSESSQSRVVIPLTTC